MLFLAAQSCIALKIVFIEAVSCGNVGAVKEWVKRKEIDVNGLTGENKGPTLTTLLCNNARVAIVLLLVDAGARADLLRPQRGLTALHCDVRLPILEILLSARPDGNVRDNLNRTALVCCARSAKFAHHERLLNAKANAASDDPRDFSPLIEAIESASSAIVTLLLEAGADIGQRQAIGREIRPYTLYRSVVEIAQTLARQDR